MWSMKKYEKGIIVAAMVFQVYVAGFAVDWLWSGGNTTAENVFLYVVAVLVTGKLISNLAYVKKNGLRWPTVS